jgi:uncharacterized protein
MAATLIFKPNDEISDKYKVLKHLNSGGAGQVYEVMQKGLELKRALKVLKPENSKNPDYIKPLQQEIQVLSQLTHQNIVKIIDCSDQAATNFFFVMELIDGPDLKTAVVECASFEGMIELFAQLIDSLCYLHERRILHCDIKPDNVRIQSDRVSGHRQVKLLDLGAAKILTEPTTAGNEFKLESDSARLTQLMGTRFYAPREIQHPINSHPVSREELAKLFPYMDLYTLGATFAECVSQLKLSQQIEDSLEQLLDKPHDWINQEDDQWVFLKGFVKRLLSKTSSPLRFRSIAEAREAFLRITPARALPTRVPELTDISATRAIRAPDGMRYFTERTYKLITHPTFQRLQKFNQLSFVDLIYPWGRHSRFSHSLDVFSLARKVTLSLLKDSTFRLLVQPEDISAFLCSALLHDVGHFPLAHVIEDVPGVQLDSALAQGFLERSNGGSPLSKLTNDLWGLDASTIQHMVDRKKYADKLNPARRFFQHLLDGPLDIDKMAYVHADSRHTGVPFGEGVDTDFLIGSFTALSKLSRPNLEADEAEIMLGIQAKGAEAAVGLISARASLYGRVYWHHTNRAISAMIQYVAVRVFDLKNGGIGFERYRDDTWNMSEYEALRYLVNHLPDSGECTKENNPVSGIIDGSRIIYKRLASYSNTAKENEEIRSVFQALSTASAEQRDTWRHLLLRRFAALVNSKSLRDWDVLIDVPKSQKQNDASTNLHVTGTYDTKSLRKLAEVHPVARSLHEQFVENVSKARVFIHPRLRNQFRELGVTAQAIEAVTAVIAREEDE